MSIAALNKRLNKISQILRETEFSKFTTFRDENAYLHVQFKNDKSYRLPIIDLRNYQIETQKKLFVEGIKRFLLVRPRRAGKEVESWNFIVESALEKPGLYLMIYPNNNRARMELCDGAISLPDCSSLRYVEKIPERIIKKKVNDEMKIELINGSIIRCLGSDIDPHKLRGTNALGVVMSEFAYCDPMVMHVLMPALRQNNGWLICQTTFNGMNHAYKLWQNNKDNPLWYCRVDSVEDLRDDDGNRYITDEMIDEDRRAGMPEYLIQQEYYSAVQLNEESLYFAAQVKFLYENDRIISDLYLPNKPVYTFWDIGRRDANGVTMVQFDHRMNPYIVAYFESNNKTPDYYFTESSRIAMKMGLRVKAHYVPHDGAKRDYNSGKDTIDIGQEQGETVFVVDKPHRKIEAIQQMRKMIYRCRFNKELADRLIDGISNYSKVYDEKLGVYKNEELHNWASHIVCSFQTMTLAIDANMINEVSRDIIYTR